METNEIIRHIHDQWLVAKEERRRRCEECNKTDAARKLAMCDAFKGSEDISALARLFTSPQGVEFCLAANFPTLATLRLFKPYAPERYGIYIDAGNISLTNPAVAVLIGKTNATIEFNTCARHKVITMHGASATVQASGWAVVRTEAGVSTNIVRRASEHAIIL